MRITEQRISFISTVNDDVFVKPETITTNQATTFIMKPVVLQYKLWRQFFNRLLRNGKVWITVSQATSGPQSFTTHMQMKKFQRANPVVAIYESQLFFREALKATPGLREMKATRGFQKEIWKWMERRYKMQLRGASRVHARKWRIS